ncbi:MAG: NADH-quinone oxidoreductase subunit NuoH [Chloroflexi bacterium]|nr:NADH-quinone oxidoreductase subunit NuoH [Chloroflexota bacterium]
MLLLFLPAWLVDLLLTVLAIAVLIVFLVIVVMSQVYLERRVIARMQDRLGPNRVGPFGVLQPVADVMKLLTKEDIIPSQADRILFRLAPIIVLVPALLIYAVIPFGQGMTIADVNIGILYAIAIGTLTTIGILMAGWSSNNKYALLAAMRAVAQMVSYEVPLVLSVVGVIMLAGSMSMVDIVNTQRHLWYIVPQFLGFFVYFTAATAELNRSPFDLLEADSEIVAGYHIEYSGIRFALFFLAEYLNAFAIAALAATLFLGGWLGPFLPPYIWFLIKSYGLFFILLWLRGTLPRVRVDHLMGFAWKILLPLALVNILITGVGLSISQASV